jgi:Na+-translocating ferredoxin:NAD+ oxidoreductase subunit G
MKEIVKLGGLLMLISVIAATALAGIYTVTKPKIEYQKQFALEQALMTALPGAAQDAVFPIEKDGRVLYYEGFKSADKTQLIGYAFIGQWPGYSSVIETMVGVDTTGNIIGLKVLDQKETPGLGTRTEEIKHGENDSWFQRQFLGKDAAALKVDKDGGEIQSITGATISSRAVTRSVVAAFQELKAQQSRSN